MRQLPRTAQQAIQGRFAGHVPTLIGPARHDLTGCKVLELLAVEQRERGLSLGLTEPVRRWRGDAFDAGTQIAFAATFITF